ncbi:hypothetical protein [Haliangium sp.]|uniref:hypothetical protein n=1 Tax=Haliangium sp. TaxID=2663208 RepID=UPI003D118719
MTRGLGRRAPSRSLPIIVGFGVAVGVFGGLMIIRGTGPSNASEDLPELTGVDDGDQGQGTTAGGDEPAVAAADAGAAEVVAEAASFDAAPPEPELRVVTVRFDVKPGDAVVEVDGEEVDGDSYELELQPGEGKTLEVVATADGYRDYSETVTLGVDDKKKTVAIRLDKVKPQPATRRPPRRGSGRRQGSGRRGSGRNSGALIDL